MSKTYIHAFIKRIVAATFGFALLLGAAGCSTENGAGDMVLFGVALETSRGGAGVTIESAAGYYSISEYYGELELTAVLNTAPNEDVSFTLQSSDTTEQTVSPETLTFTPENWATPQTFTVTAVDDYEIDGNQVTQVVYGSIVSNDSLYSGKAIDSTEVTVIDNETYSVSVSPSSLTTVESGTTGEGDSITNKAEFWVFLSLEPTANVTISSFAIGQDEDSETDEGTVSPTSLTFTPANWNEPQKVTVTAGNDSKEDGTRHYTITPATVTSTDSGYNGIQPGTVSMTNMDEDSTVTVSPVNIELIEAPSGDCSSGEWGDCEKDIEVKVQNFSSCGGNLTITPSVSPADARVSFDPASLTFTENITKTITVKITDDSIENSNRAFTINFAVDDAGDTCDNKPVDTINLAVADDEGPGVRVSKVSRITRENIPQDATFRVYLTKAPAAGTTVTVPIVDDYDVNNYLHNEGYVNKTTLLFTPENWSTEQTVTVNPVSDYELDGDIQYIIKVDNTVSSDPDYHGIDPRDVTINNFNEDEVGVIVNTNSSTTEITTSSNQSFNGYATDDANNMGHQYASWQIKLKSKPSSNVVLTLNGNNPSAGSNSDGILSATSLTFTRDNWNEYQAVTVEGSSDGTNEGNHTYTINTTYSTTDGNYSALGKPSFVINSCDNDASNQVVECFKSGGYGQDTTTAENNGTGYRSFITQNSCSGGITFNVTGGDTDEGVVTTNVTIDSSNFNKIENGTNRVIVTGQDDSILDGSKTFQISDVSCTGCLDAGAGACVTGLASSYSFSNTDNEYKWITTNPTDTNEGDTSSSGEACLQLGTNPAGTMTVSVTCSDSTECESLSTSSLTFYTGDWYDVTNSTCNGTCKRCVNVDGKDDDLADGTQNISVTFKVTSGDGGIYGVNDSTSVNVANADNENAAKRVWVTSTNRNGEFSPGVSAADAYCNGSDARKPPSGTYKALIVDNAGGARTTGKDVLSANTQYYDYAANPGGIDSSSDVLFRTNASKDVDGDFSGSYGGFDTEKLNITGASDFWTGMDPGSLGIKSGYNATPQNNCGTEWTFVQDGSNTIDYYGGAWSISSGNVTDSWQLCSSTRKFICIEQ